MNENLSRNYFEICEKKLTGESSIGILGTLIAGFSISLIPNIVKLEDCECILWTNNNIVQEILIWINTFKVDKSNFFTHKYFHISSVLSILFFWCESFFFNYFKWCGMADGSNS